MLLGQDSSPWPCTLALKLGGVTEAPSMWLQPPQGLPMPAPIVMPELDPVTREQRWEAQAFRNL